MGLRLPVAAATACLAEQDSVEPQANKTGVVARKRVALYDYNTHLAVSTHAKIRDETRCKAIDALNRVVVHEIPLNCIQSRKVALNRMYLPLPTYVR